MSNRADAAKVKSTDRAGIQSKSKSRDISSGNLMDGDVRSEFEYLRLHQLKADIRDKAAKDGGGGEAMRALAANFKHESESEIVAAKMLKYLNGLSDYSAEFAQISSVAGMTSRVEIARDLAKKYTDSHSTQIVLDKMLANDDGRSTTEVIADAFERSERSGKVNGVTMAAAAGGGSASNSG